ncbi:MAG: arabinogalactan endo-1,4-beta-galactosidase [Blautia sp.]|nr:arabinogalactan endo-1,4-beta-galactosidase [Lachnoclostridium sp.]MCM1212212.1 arabinogalactan endo-1,4-beta-galactosidase [Blautia sp.]
MKEKIVLGVDLGWVSQLESRGIRWVDDDGNQIDPLQAVKNMGANTVRLRVFVNPPKEAFWQKKDGSVCMLGFADKESVLEMAKRVKDMDMDLMIDFHYSDHFADPQYQDIPDAWKADDAEGLKERVYSHTKEVLTLLGENGIYPVWVQVGNEINPGILHPYGSLKENPETLVKFLNAGYEAAKECCPDCKVITHITGVYRSNWCDPFLENFFKNGGKTDVLGFSHYPYWFKVEQSAEFLLGHLMRYEEQYHMPIMICEVGGPEEDAELTYNLIVNTIKALESLPEDEGLGVVYWEPEVGAVLLPDKYPLGAARLLDEHTLQFTNALKAYQDYR